jgi:hypothetical protein
LNSKHYAKAKNVFWIASIICSILLAIHVLFSTSITQYSASDLGLLSKLPATFWIGLLFLGVILFISTKFEGPTIIVFLVVALIVFYLFGLPVLMQENKAIGLAYWYSSKGVYMEQFGSIDFAAQNPWDPINWPGYFILTASLSSITGLSATVLSDYFPLLTIALLGILTYYTLRLRFKAVYASLGALWVIASFWTGQHYFSPQATAFVMYLAIFLLSVKTLLTRNKKSAFTLSIIILFIGIVATHLLTSFIIMLGILVVYFLYRIFNLKGLSRIYPITICALLPFIFFAYQLFIVKNSFHEFTKALAYQFFQQENPVSISLQARAGGSTSLLFQIISNYGITIISLVLAVVGIFATLIGIAMHKRESKNDLFWIAWILVPSVVGLSIVYGAEAINRAFMFILLPTAYFAMKFLTKKISLLLAILVILSFLSIPALYSSQNYAYVLSSELKGTSFYTNYAPPLSSFFYEPVCPLLPYGSNIGNQISLSVIAGIRSLPSQELVSWTTTEAAYVITSNMEKNFYTYFYGVNVLENISLDSQRSRVYDSADFQIFMR